MRLVQGKGRDPVGAGACAFMQAYPFVQQARGFSRSLNFPATLAKFPKHPAPDILSLHLN